jgi:hypothetical protein
MQPILLLATLLYATLSYSFSFSLLEAQNLSPDERQKAQALFEEVSNRLPPSLKDALTDEVKVKFTGTDSKIIISCDSGTKGTTFLGKRTSILGQEHISMNRAFLGESSTYPCKHKNTHDEAIATLLHETAHVYEGHVSNSPSRQRTFRSLVYFMKNKLSERSPDPYEFKSYNESFAVNFEYFILDPQYQCRKPGLNKFFSDHFQFQPSLAADCRPSRHAKMQARVFYIDFDPKKLYQIDYLMAGPGKALMSRFGHSMVRLVFCKDAANMGPKCLNDISQHVVLSFRANMSGASNQYLGGLTGSFPSQLFISNFPKVADEYNRDEFRSLFAYPLKLTQAQKEAFLVHALSVHWSYSGKYFFTHNNCAVETKQLIAAILPEDHDFRKTKSPTPAALRDDLYDTGLIDDPKLVKDKPGTLFFQTQHKEDLSLALANIEAALNQSFELSDYLKSSALERESWFSQVKESKVKMSFFMLEHQISKQLNTKLADELNKLLKKKDIAPEDQKQLKEFLTIQAKLSPWENIKGSPYGLVARHEIDVDGATEAAKKFALGNEVLIKILTKYEPDLVAEYNQTIKNLAAFFK